ncbi:MAG: hypothetical protein R2801_08660 [Chitinophagales bacterium]|nr:hypothetical protein [Romboutsia sp.]
MQLELSNTAFWDIDMTTLNQTNKNFIIARVFMYGKFTDIKTIIKHYSKQEISEALKQYRGLDQYTISFAKALGYL